MNSWSTLNCLYYRNFFINNKQPFETKFLNYIFLLLQVNCLISLQKKRFWLLLLVRIEIVDQKDLIQIHTLTIAVGSNDSDDS